MANYIYKGYGVTDSNGIAKLEYDANGDPLSHSYTGVGAGEVDFIASTDAPADISDSSFQTEIYEVFDCLVYDSGVTGSTASWYESTTIGTMTLSDGRTLANSESGNYQVFLKKASTDTGVYLYDPSFAVEFDVTAITGTVRFQIYSNSTSNGSNWDFSQTGHYKITYDGTTVKKYYNNTLFDSVSATIGTARVGFIVEQNESVTFKNFMIYPI